jgi:hypothetical protein
LSNFQIIEKCKELKIKNFRGVFMRNELKNNKALSDECMVINIDHSSNEGTHWTCLFIKDGVSFYFDSYGFEPTLEVIEYCTSGLVSSREPRYYSSYPIQKINEVICGHYCTFVLYRLSKGDNFYNICDELYNYSNKI